jgi:cytochrome c-type biogenesis protein CcmH
VYPRRVLRTYRGSAVAVVLLITGILLVPATRLAAQPPAVAINEPEVYEIASQLRCVVCQNLSVADSPSEMAAQMRAVIRERLAAGDRPAQVIEYFVEKYGEWILLSPRRSGFNLLVWLLPPFAILVGVVLVALVVRRWTRRRTPAPPAVDAAMSERIRRELESGA